MALVAVGLLAFPLFGCGGSGSLRSDVQEGSAVAEGFNRNTWIFSRTVSIGQQELR